MRASRTTGSEPDSSPARTTATYRRSKMCGCRPSASAKLDPAVMASRTSSSTRRKRLFVVSLASALRMRARCRPPASIAASWPVKTRSVSRLTPRVTWRSDAWSPWTSAARPSPRPARPTVRTSTTSRPCSRKRRIRAPWLSASVRPRLSTPRGSATSYSKTGMDRQSWSATTAITSSSVVSPWATRRKPTVRRVIMPASAADRRTVSASTPSITMRRTAALMPNTS